MTMLSPLTLLLLLRAGAAFEPSSLRPAYRVARRSVEIRAAGKRTESISPRDVDVGLDEVAFLESMSREIEAVEKLREEFGALDGSAEEEPHFFDKLDEATARMAHTTDDMYTRAARRLESLARESVERSAMERLREERVEAERIAKRLSELRSESPSILGFAFVSIAAFSVGMVVSNPSFDPSYLASSGLPQLDFGGLPTVDFSSFGREGLDLSSVDFSRVEGQASDFFTSLSARIATLGEAADSATPAGTTAGVLDVAATLERAAESDGDALLRQMTEGLDVLPLMSGDAPPDFVDATIIAHALGLGDAVQPDPSTSFTDFVDLL